MLPIIYVLDASYLLPIFVVDSLYSGLGIGFVSHAEIGQDPRLINLEIDTGNAEMTETLMYLTARKEVPLIRAFLKAAEKP